MGRHDDLTKGNGIETKEMVGKGGRNRPTALTPEGNIIVVGMVQG